MNENETKDTDTTLLDEASELETKLNQIQYKFFSFTHQKDVAEIDLMFFYYFYQNQIKKLQSELKQIIETISTESVQKEKKQIIEKNIRTFLFTSLFYILSHWLIKIGFIDFENLSRHTHQLSSWLFEFFLVLILTCFNFAYPYCFPIFIIFLCIQTYRNFNLLKHLKVKLQKTLSNSQSFFKDTLHKYNDFEDSIYDEKLKRLCDTKSSEINKNILISSQDMPQILPPIRIFGSNPNAMIKNCKDGLNRSEELVILTFYFFENQICIIQTNVDVLFNEVKVSRQDWKYEDISNINVQYFSFEIRHYSGSISINISATSYTKLEYLDPSFSIDNSKHICILEQIVKEKKEAIAQKKASS